MEREEGVTGRAMDRQTEGEQSRSTNIKGEERKQEKLEGEGKRERA